MTFFRPVNNTLDIIIELVETGADVLSASELNQLQGEGKKLKERYDFVSDNSDKLLKRMLSSIEELGKFRSEKGVFCTWMEKSYKILEDKERQLANLNKLQGNTDDIKEFVSDVMTHGADLKFLTISGQKYVQLSKVNKNLSTFFISLSCNLNMIVHKPTTSQTRPSKVTISLDKKKKITGYFHNLLLKGNAVIEYQI